MAKITIIRGLSESDKSVTKDGRAAFFDIDPFLPDTNIHAIQWLDTAGTIEHPDNSVTSIVDFSPYNPLLAEYQAIIDAEDAAAAALEPTPLEAAKSEKQNEANVGAAEKIVSDLSGFSFFSFFLDDSGAVSTTSTIFSLAGNISVFSAVISEAAAWDANPATPTPKIDAILAISGELKADFVADSLAFEAQKNQTVLAVAAKRRDYTDQIIAAADIPAVDAIVVDYS